MDFELFGFENEIENNTTIISARKIKIHEKIKGRQFLKKQKCNEILDEIPLKNECLCIVSNGTFDYFNSNNNRINGRNN